MEEVSVEYSLDPWGGGSEDKLWDSFSIPLANPKITKDKLLCRQEKEMVSGIAFEKEDAMCQA